jgi:GntR family transcriptional regulator
MIFRIDFDAATAVYRQLVDQIRHAAAAGTLKPRDPLPTIRPLASQLHLNRNTVAKAYTELESLGVIKTIPGKGSFIEPVNTPFTPAVRHKLLVTKIDAALVAAHQLQVDARSFAALVAERTRFFERKNKDAKVPEPPSGDASPSESPIRKTVRTPKAPQTQSSQTRPKPGAPSSSQAPAPLPSPSVSQTLSILDSDGWTPSMD